MRAAKEIEENWSVRERLAVSGSVPNPTGPILNQRGTHGPQVDAEFHATHDAANRTGRVKVSEANILFAEDPSL